MDIRLSCTCSNLLTSSKRATWYGDQFICDVCSLPRLPAAATTVEQEPGPGQASIRSSITSQSTVEPNYSRPGQASRRSRISSQFISSTPSIAGFEIVKHCGLVTELSSASGWTAKSKGNNALDKAIFGFVDTAVELGANAVVSVTFSTFGAGGGITSIVGGDAVGVLITGTAVVIQPIET